jgi:hypothetical protein
MAPGDFVFFRNIPLTDSAVGGQTSTVGEPSLGNNGRELFLTGNWYATRSLDNGTTWSYVSPYNALPPLDGGFCCDQIVHYDRGRDLLFWLLQYREQGGKNSLRLAVKRGATLGNDVWFWWDFSPVATNSAWAGEWFDYPDLELGNDFLYLTSNVFRASDDRWTRSVIFRIPLDTLATGGSLDYQFWSTTQTFSLRCTRGARDVMYFASHTSNSQVRVYSWPETSASVSSSNVNVSAWSAGSYSAPGPDGANWLSRCDPRITGAWVANGVIGLAWSANRRGSRPFPYVRVVRIAEATMSVVADADIWSANHAYAYPDACPNDRGHVGITLFRGGGNRHPGHVVGIWDDFSNAWQLVATADGTNGPTDTKWGDYLACRRHSPDGLTWLASGYTLQGGGGRDSIEPRVVHFGRRRDERAVQRWESA